MSNRDNYICPVCKNTFGGAEQYCSVCGWSIPEDVSMNRLLFAGSQVEEYENRLKIYQTIYRNGSRQLQLRIRELEETVARLKAENEKGSLKYETEDGVPLVEENTFIPMSEMKFVPATEAREFLKKNGDFSRERMEASGIDWFAERINHAEGIRKNLTAIYSVEEFCKCIENGSPEFCVGDYLDIEINSGELRTETVRFILAGVDCLEGEYKRPNGEVCKHYAVLIPDKCLSELYTYYKNMVKREECEKELKKYSKLFKRTFGNHLLQKDGEESLQLLSVNQLSLSDEYVVDCLAEVVDNPHTAIPTSIPLDTTSDLDDLLPLFREYPKALNVSSNIFGSYPNITPRVEYRVFGHNYWLKDKDEEADFEDPKDYSESDAYYVMDPRFGIRKESADHKAGLRPYFCIG